MDIIPVEAKGGEEKSAPSFKRYIAERHPKYAIRFSKRGYRKDGAITNIPLYLVRKDVYKRQAYRYVKKSAVKQQISPFGSFPQYQ